ncbi:hypothetical protein EVAR_96498_1 [Eumeta japonica]|uniref:Uncharacterized protein n=1 Tax=Eumeta variegata TaxID=151549 RepID=A0A4C1ZUC5_EUMVA|nr:hypothetical protein EVAR_96498_1 [Eumeta japonica]
MKIYTSIECLILEETFVPDVGSQNLIHRRTDLTKTMPSDVTTSSRSLTLLRIASSPRLRHLTFATHRFNRTYFEDLLNSEHVDIVGTCSVPKHTVQVLGKDNMRTLIMDIKTECDEDPPAIRAVGAAPSHAPEDSMAGTAALVKEEGDVMIKTEDEMDDMMIKQELDIGPILLQSKVTCSALSPSDQLTTILRRYLGMFFFLESLHNAVSLAELKVFLMSKVATQAFLETPFHLVLILLPGWYIQPN